MDRLRRICMAFDGVSEKLSHGEPSWFVNGRQFVTTSDHHHDDRLGFWCAAPPFAQKALIESNPRRYFLPPYVGHRGWLGVYLDVDPVNWKEIAAHLEDAHSLVASKR